MADSLEILEKFFGIGPKFERSMGDQSFKSHFQELFEDFFVIIPENFSRIFPYIFLRFFQDLGVGKHLNLY